MELFKKEYAMFVGENLMLELRLFKTQARCLESAKHFFNSSIQKSLRGKKFHFVIQLN